MKYRALGTVFVLLTCASCSSLKGRHVVENTPPEDVEHTKGAPYYLTKPSFRIERKRLHDGKKAAPVNELVITPVPDYSHRFEVGMTAGVFTSDTFVFSTEADGRISALSSKRTDETGKVIVGMAKLAVAVARLVAFSSADLVNVIDDAATTGLIDTKEQTDVKNAITTLDAALQSNQPLPPAELKTWKMVSDKIRKGLVEQIKQGLQALDRVNTSPVPPSPALREPEVVKAEQNVFGVFDNIEIIDTYNKKLISAAPPKASETIQTLRKKVDDTLAAAIADLNNTTKQQALTQALHDFSNAVALILKADESLNNRGLGARRGVLVNFLKTQIPSNANGNNSKAYADLAGELDKVMATISTVLGNATPTPTPLPLATVVTSVVDDKIHVDQLAGKPIEEDLQGRLKLADARVRFGGSRAVLITYPAH